MASRSLPRLAAPALALSAALLASGCIVAPLGPRYGGVVEDGAIVTTAPPAPQYEGVGVAPAVGMLWIGGYWGWAGGRYHWRPGHWTQGRPGHHWVPHAWSPVRGGWVHRPGYWRRG